MIDNKKFKELSFKDKASYITAIASFILGWGLLFAGFIVEPVGEIHTSILTAFGTALVYAGAVFGIALYISDKSKIIKGMMQSFQDNIEKRFEEIEKKNNSDDNTY